MNDWIKRYIACQFPIIPLGRRSKSPVARGWVENSYPASAFRNGNVGTRAGERVNVDGRQGYLLIVDFDSPDVSILRQLCETIPLPRTTCVRSGGVHRGYHLYYLTEEATRKRGMLAYKGASVDLLGKGSFAVVPPSVVDEPYRYLIGLDELAFLSSDGYDQLVATLSHWKRVNAVIKHVTNGKLTYDQAREQLIDQQATPEMIAHLCDSLNDLPAD